MTTRRPPPLPGTEHQHGLAAVKRRRKATKPLANKPKLAVKIGERATQTQALDVAGVGCPHTPSQASENAVELLRAVRETHPLQLRTDRAARRTLTEGDHGTHSPRRIPPPRGDRRTGTHALHVLTMLSCCRSIHPVLIYKTIA